MSSQFREVTDTRAPLCDGRQQSDPEVSINEAIFHRDDEEQVRVYLPAQSVEKTLNATDGEVCDARYCVRGSDGAGAW
jgi:hypothetical protein